MGRQREIKDTFESTITAARLLGYSIEEEKYNLQNGNVCFSYDLKIRENNTRKVFSLDLYCDDVLNDVQAIVMKKNYYEILEGKDDIEIISIINCLKNDI